MPKLVTTLVGYLQLIIDISKYACELTETLNVDATSGAMPQDVRERIPQQNALYRLPSVTDSMHCKYVLLLQYLSNIRASSVSTMAMILQLQKDIWHPRHAHIQVVQSHGGGGLDPADGVGRGEHHQGQHNLEWFNHLGAEAN